MSYLIYHFIETHNYTEVIIIKNILVSILAFIAGSLVTTFFHSYKSSLVVRDKKGIMKEEDIAMMIIKKGKKKTILLPNGRISMSENMSYTLIFLLYMIGFKKLGRVTWKNARRVKSVFRAFMVFFIILLILSIVLPFSVTREIVS